MRIFRFTSFERFPLLLLFTKFFRLFDVLLFKANGKSSFSFLTGDIIVVCLLFTIAFSLARMYNCASHNQTFVFVLLYISFSLFSMNDKDKH